MPITLDWIKVQYFMDQRGIEDANELAVLAETHRSSMHRVSTGKSLPNMQTLARMCFYLGCQPGDLLNYEHSELDLSKPHLLFGLFPINQKVWTKFRKLDKGWRKSIGRWELKSGYDMVDYHSGGTYKCEWKSMIPEFASDSDGKMVEVEFSESLRKLLHTSYDDRGIKDFSDKAVTCATFEIAEAIAESFHKYRWKKNPPKPNYTPDDEFESLDQLEAVYEKDPKVLEARSAYKAYHNHETMKEERHKAEWLSFEPSEHGLEVLNLTRLGCEIERDWHMLSHYAYANSIDDLIDYAEQYVMPIHNMDKEIKQFDRWISNLASRLGYADKAIASAIEEGMGDKED